MRNFYRFQKIWKPDIDYLYCPWRYYKKFLEILKTRNVSFITMKMAVEGDFNPDSVNVILDHHIDSSPIETEIFVKWEMDNNIISSIYIFNEDYEENPYRLEDLNISLFKEAEEKGWEIGYHFNGIGLAKYKMYGTFRDVKLDENILNEAREILLRDIQKLEQYFNISTFIPHGGGQGNIHFKYFPQGFLDLYKCVYNSSVKGIWKGNKYWNNWTDTAGESWKSQLVEGYGAYYILHVDNLHLKAYLAKPGLNHILIHPSKFAAGLPYEEYSEEIRQEIICRAIFPLKGRITPLHIYALKHGFDLPEMLSSGENFNWNSFYNNEIVEDLVSRKYYLLTDDEHTLFNGIKDKDNIYILNYVKHESFNDDNRELFKTKKGAWDIFDWDKAYKIINGDELIISDLEDNLYYLYNTIYSNKIFHHLLCIPLVYDILVIRKGKMRNSNELAGLLEVLKKYRYSRYLEIHIELLGELKNEGAKILKEQNIDKNIPQEYKYFLKADKTQIDSQYTLILKKGLA